MQQGAQCWPYTLCETGSTLGGCMSRYAKITFQKKTYDRIWLVVWNMTFIFHHIWDVILPID